MDMIKQNTPEVNDPYFDMPKENASVTFDIILWLYRMLKYWYLFVISIFLCLGVAHLKNKSWVPIYTVGALVMLEERGESGIVNAVRLGTILRNSANQQTLVMSYGMTERTVDRLPSDMSVNYFRQDGFRHYWLYDNTPVVANIDTCYQAGYQFEYTLTYVDNKSCKISYYPNGPEMPEISFVAKYGEKIENNLFSLTLEKTDKYIEKFEPLQLAVLSKNTLIGMYAGGTVAMLSETGSAMHIMRTGPDPKRDAEYLETLLDEFQSYNLQLKNMQADLTISFLNKQIGVINDSLQNARRTLNNFQKATGVYEITSNQLHKEISEADVEKENLAIKERALIAYSQKINETILGDDEILTPKDLGIEDTALGTMVASYNAIISKSKYLGPKNPLYNKTIDELNTSRNQILKTIHENQILLQEQKDLLIAKFRLLNLKEENLPPQERDLIKLEREYKVNEVYHQFLTQKRYEAQIQKESNTPDNFVWEAPRIVSGPNNGGEKQTNYFYWFMIGALVPAAFVVCKEELFNNTISTKEECEKISGLPVIGTVENISNKLKSGVVLVKNFPKSSFAESFRNMRVRLAYMAKREDKISVLITSAEPADGKTFIATNIASVYQLMGKKVVIVDLDLRRPSVSKTLKIGSKDVGVSNYLIGQVPFEEIVFTHADYGFDIIPAGTLPPNPSELIRTEKTGQLIRHLQGIYDYVIIDCSPVGLVSDAYVLAPLVDTTLFAVRRGKTNKSFFKSVITQLRMDGVQNAALIFNDVKGREGYYGTSRYYGDKTYYLKKKNSYYHDDYFEN